MQWGRFPIPERCTRCCAPDLGLRQLVVVSLGRVTAAGTLVTPAGKRGGTLRFAVLASPGRGLHGTVGAKLGEERSAIGERSAAGDAIFLVFDGRVTTAGASRIHVWVPLGDISVGTLGAGVTAVETRDGYAKMASLPDVHPERQGNVGWTDRGDERVSEDRAGEAIVARDDVDAGILGRGDVNEHCGSAEYRPIVGVVEGEDEALSDRVDGVGGDRGEVLDSEVVRGR